MDNQQFKIIEKLLVKEKKDKKKKKKTEEELFEKPKKYKSINR
tara:strand:+ start:1406 stop:1534 length:129 start_codon:yes stop_codon:yes gene_type:complete